MYFSVSTTVEKLIFSVVLEADLVTIKSESGSLTIQIAL